MTIEERIYDYINKYKSYLYADITPTYIRLSQVKAWDENPYIIHINKYLIKKDNQIYKSEYDKANILFYVIENIDNIHYFNFDEKILTSLKIEKRDTFIDSLNII